MRHVDSAQTLRLARLPRAWLAVTFIASSSTCQCRRRCFGSLRCINSACSPSVWQCRRRKHNMHWRRGLSCVLFKLTRLRPFPPHPTPTPLPFLSPSFFHTEGMGKGSTFHKHPWGRLLSRWKEGAPAPLHGGQHREAAVWGGPDRHHGRMWDCRLDGFSIYAAYRCLWYRPSVASAVTRCGVARSTRWSSCWPPLQ
jgi:hypothetical protein